MPEVRDTLALAERLRLNAEATSQPDYAGLMLQAAEDLEELVRARLGACEPPVRSAQAA